MQERRGSLATKGHISGLHTRACHTYVVTNMVSSEYFLQTLRRDHTVALSEMLAIIYIGGA